jgi:hypothetical protein
MRPFIGRASESPSPAGRLRRLRAPAARVHSFVAARVNAALRCVKGSLGQVSTAAA